MIQSIRFKKENMNIQTETHLWSHELAKYPAVNNGKSRVESHKKSLLENITTNCIVFHHKHNKKTDYYHY